MGTGGCLTAGLPSGEPVEAPAADEEASMEDWRLSCQEPSFKKQRDSNLDASVTLARGLPVCGSIVGMVFSSACICADHDGSVVWTSRCNHLTQNDGN